jgi:hypothetical protein
LRAGGLAIDPDALFMADRIFGHKACGIAGCSARAAKGHAARPDWLAGHIGLEPANPGASYLIGFA